MFSIEMNAHSTIGSLEEFKKYNLECIKFDRENQQIIVEYEKIN